MSCTSEESLTLTVMNARWLSPVRLSSSAFCFGSTFSSPSVLNVPRITSSLIAASSTFPAFSNCLKSL